MGDRDKPQPVAAVLRAVTRALGSCPAWGEQAAGSLGPHQPRVKKSAASASPVVTVILLLGVVLGGRKSLWGAVVGASLVALLPNLPSNRTLFQAFSAVGLVVALGAGLRGLARKTLRPFQALSPIFATGALVVGGFLVENTENWRKAIFALMLFSVVVGLPEGLMGFAGRFLSRLFRIEPPPLPAPRPLEEVLPARPTDGGALLRTTELRRWFGGSRRSCRSRVCPFK